MALKDWKKMKQGYNKKIIMRWMRKKSRYPRRTEDISITKYPDNYDVWHSTNPVGIHELIFRGKTESLAISKAKAYMRKH